MSYPKLYDDEKYKNVSNEIESSFKAQIDQIKIEWKEIRQSRSKKESQKEIKKIRPIQEKIDILKEYKINQKKISEIEEKAKKIEEEITDQIILRLGEISENEKDVEEARNNLLDYKKSIEIPEWLN